MNNKKITVETTTKRAHFKVMTAPTTIATAFVSSARIVGIQKQRPRRTIERKGIINEKIYFYYLAGVMIAMAGILHLVVASHVLGGLDGIIGSLVGPGLLTTTINIDKLGIFFLVAGIAQLFWSIPMTKRWGRKWYYVGICGTIALIALYATTKGPNPITTSGINIPIYDIPTEIFQIAYVTIATLIIIAKTNQRSEIKLRGG
ncbi:MAG: hypothetical protein WBQ25_16060 [Nitrososphaeraceae archaeon]